MKRFFLSTYKKLGPDDFPHLFLSSNILPNREELQSGWVVLQFDVKNEVGDALVGEGVFYAKAEAEEATYLSIRYEVAGKFHEVDLDLTSKRYRDRLFSIPGGAAELKVYGLLKSQEVRKPHVEIVKTQPVYSVSAKKLYGQDGHRIRLLSPQRRKATEITLNDALKIGSVGWGKEVTRDLLVNITIDVEDKDFSDGCLIQDDLKRWPGVLEAAYLMKGLGVEGTFFVNVYEALESSLEEKLKRICRELDGLGHEVALHTHPSSHLAWYNKELPNYSLDEQVAILSKGKKALEEWTGSEVKSYRAGGYRYNKDTIEALAKVGISIDSSFLYGFVEESLGLSEYVQPQKVGAIFEAPVTPLAVCGVDGVVRAKKADLNWMTSEEHVQLVKDFSIRDTGYLNYMLHSFSFCDRRQLGKWGDGKDESRVLSKAVCHNEVLEGKRRIVVFGEKNDETKKFTSFLLDLKDHGAKFKTIRDSQNFFENSIDDECLLFDKLPLIVY